MRPRNFLILFLVINCLNLGFIPGACAQTRQQNTAPEPPPAANSSILNVRRDVSELDRIMPQAPPIARVGGNAGGTVILSPQGNPYIDGRGPVSRNASVMGNLEVRQALGPVRPGATIATGPVFSNTTASGGKITRAAHVDRTILSDSHLERVTAEDYSSTRKPFMIINKYGRGSFVDSSLKRFAPYNGRSVGIVNRGTLNVSNSTISGYGRGISNTASGNLRAFNSTFSHNRFGIHNRGNLVGGSNKFINNHTGLLNRGTVSLGNRNVFHNNTFGIRNMAGTNLQMGSFNRFINNREAGILNHGFAKLGSRNLFQNNKFGIKNMFGGRLIMGNYNRFFDNSTGLLNRGFARLGDNNIFRRNNTFGIKNMAGAKLQMGNHNNFINNHTGLFNKGFAELGDKNLFRGNKIGIDNYSKAKVILGKDTKFLYNQTNYLIRNKGNIKAISILYSLNLSGKLQKQVSNKPDALFDLKPEALSNKPIPKNNATNKKDIAPLIAKINDPGVIELLIAYAQKGGLIPQESLEAILNSDSNPLPLLIAIINHYVTGHQEKKIMGNHTPALTAALAAIDKTEGDKSHVVKHLLYLMAANNANSFQAREVFNVIAGEEDIPVIGEFLSENNGEQATAGALRQILNLSNNAIREKTIDLYMKALAEKPGKLEQNLAEHWLTAYSQFTLRPEDIVVMLNSSKDARETFFSAILRFKKETGAEPVLDVRPIGGEILLPMLNYSEESQETLSDDINRYGEVAKSARIRENIRALPSLYFSDGLTTESKFDILETTVLIEKHSIESKNPEAITAAADLIKGIASSPEALSAELDFLRGLNDKKARLINYERISALIDFIETAGRINRTVKANDIINICIKAYTDKDLPATVRETALAEITALTKDYRSDKINPERREAIQAQIDTVTAALPEIQSQLHTDAGNYYQNSETSKWVGEIALIKAQDALLKFPDNSEIVKAAENQARLLEGISRNNPGILDSKIFEKCTVPINNAIQNGLIPEERANRIARRLSNISTKLRW